MFLRRWGHTTSGGAQGAFAGIEAHDMREFPPMPAEKARLLNPLQLAYIGDAVWDMLIRMNLIHSGRNLRHMHQEAIRTVCAKAQAAALEKVLPHLDEQEQDIVRRGRNTHAKHPCPKNQDPADYAAATGFEALLGYLYLTGSEERLMTLYHITQQEV